MSSAAPGGTSDPADLGFGGTGFPGTWRRHQAAALDAVDAALAAGRSATYLVLPPGAGKTLVGAEAARRLGRRTLVLAPNTAIQAQWLDTWRRSFTPATVPAGHDRDLGSPLTVLTYQALATFDPDTEVTPDGGRRRRSRGETLAGLHPNGRALVEAMRATGPWTLVLDECHHLIEVWGRLIADLLALLTADHGDVAVIGLTATPRTSLTAEQAALVEEMFGGVTYAVSTPAVVKTGDLAPFQELAWFTGPTPDEARYIDSEALRFEELRTDLLDPSFASVPFLGWCDTRFVRRQAAGSAAPVPWSRVERETPELADAALRLHSAGLLALPDGARVREQHRAAPTAEDWVALIEDYVRGCLQESGNPDDAAAVQAIRAALPAVGYSLTRRGVRAGTSPVDRVLARSAAKTAAVAGILATETGVLGPAVRALVLCDYERAGAQLSARLRGVLDEQAGSARLVLSRLATDPVTGGLDPVLMTGRTVAARRDTAARLVAALRAADPALDLDDVPVDGDPADVVEVTGRWSSRRWVPAVTAWFQGEEGRVLIGTRALLGEGWDAARLNVVIDLTSATTSTAVVQTRGRALRRDPRMPDKVATTWSVVAVTAAHPKGAADYRRFVAKHDGFFALDADGQCASGVPHVDADLSPFAPPPAELFEELNVRMRARAADRAATRAAWRVGEPFEDVEVASVRIRPARPLDVTGDAVHRLAPARRLRSAPPLVLTGAGAGLAAGLATDLAVTGPGGHVAAAALTAVGAGGGSVVTTVRLLGAADDTSGLADVAAAVADGLQAAGIVPAGAGSVRVQPAPDGTYRALLDDVDEAASAAFAEALDEVLAPPAAPRYLVSRLSLHRPADRRGAYRLAVGRLFRRPLPAGESWHAVPAVLAANRARAEGFAEAWSTHVGPTRLLSAASPEGAGVLAACRGADPFAVTTQLRTVWR